MSDTDPPAGPDLQTMKIQVYETLGNLVKSWSTGDAQYTGGKLHPVPTTINELKNLLQFLGAGADIPDHINKLTIIRYEANEMVLRIPPADLIKAKEARLKQPGVAYQVPLFYEEVPIKGSQANASEDDKMLLQARRIGDYTIAHCE